MKWKTVYRKLRGKKIFKGIMLIDSFQEPEIKMKKPKFKRPPIYKDTTKVDPEYLKFPHEIRDHLVVDGGRWILTPRGEELMKEQNERP